MNLPGMYLFSGLRKKLESQISYFLSSENLKVSSLSFSIQKKKQTISMTSFYIKEGMQRKKTKYLTCTVYQNLRRHGVVEVRLKSSPAGTSKAPYGVNTDCRGIDTGTLSGIFKTFVYI